MLWLKTKRIQPNQNMAVVIQHKILLCCKDIKVFDDAWVTTVKYNNSTKRQSVGFNNNLVSKANSCI